MIGDAFLPVSQQAQAGDPPILIRIDTRAGHGAGISTSKRMDEIADHWAFLLNELGG
jgi:prolyl oligopeptidase